MPITREIRAKASSAMCRKDGFPALKRMFDDGTLDRAFALRELKRAIVEDNKFYRIELLCEAANIKRSEVRNIAIEVCQKGLVIADYYLQKKMHWKASTIERWIEDIICDHGLLKNEDGTISELFKQKIHLMLRIMEQKGNPNYPAIRDFYRRNGYDV